MKIAIRRFATASVAVLVAALPAAAQRALVADSSNQRVVFVDTQTGEQSPVALGGVADGPIAAIHAAPRAGSSVVYLARVGRRAIAILDPDSTGPPRELSLKFYPERLIPIGDGRYVWVWGDGLGAVIDSASDQVVGQIIPSYEGPVGAVGDELVIDSSSSASESLQLINPFTGRRRWIPLAQPGRVVALDATRGHVVIAHGSGGLSVVDLSDGGTIARVYTRYPIRRVAIAPNGGWAYAVDDQGDILEIDLKAQRVGGRLQVAADREATVRIAPDGLRAYVSTNAGLMVIDTSIGLPEMTLDTAATAFSLAPDGWLLLAYSQEPGRDWSVKLFDQRQPAESFASLSVDELPITSFSADGRYAFVASRSRMVRIDRDSRYSAQEIWLGDGGAFVPERIVSAGNKAFVTSERGVAIVDLASEAVDSIVPYPEGYSGVNVARIAAAPDGQSIFLAVEGSELIWRYFLATDHWTPLPVRTSGLWRAIGVSADGTTLAIGYSAAGTGHVVAINLATGATTSDVNVGGCAPATIATSPSGQRITISCLEENAGSTRVIDIDSLAGRVVHGTEAVSDGYSLRAVEVSSNGTSYVAASIGAASCFSGPSYLVLRQHGAATEQRVAMRDVRFGDAFVDDARDLLIATDRATNSIVVANLATGDFRLLPVAWTPSAIAPVPPSLHPGGPPPPGPVDIAVFAGGLGRVGTLVGSSPGGFNVGVCDEEGGGAYSTRISAAGFTWDGRTALIATYDSVLVIADPVSGRSLGSIPLPYDVEEVVVSSDDALAFLRPARENGIGVVDINARRFVVTLAADLQFHDLETATDPRYLYALEGTRIAVFDTTNGGIVRSIEIPGGPLAFAVHDAPWSLYAAWPDQEAGTRLASLREDGSILATTITDGFLHDLEATSDGRVYASLGGAVVEFDSDLETTRTLPLLNASSQIKLSRDGRFLYSADDDLEVYDLESGERVLLVPVERAYPVVALGCGRDCPAVATPPERTPANLFPTLTPKPSPTPYPRPTRPVPLQPYDTIAADEVRLAAGGSGTLAIRYYGQTFFNSVQHEIRFDPRAGIAGWVDGRPDCTTHFDRGVFTFVPRGCVPGEDCTGLQAVITDRYRISDPFDSVVLYECRAEVSAAAPPGRYPILLSPTTAWTCCDARPITELAGAILVGDEPEPPLVPPSAPTGLSCGIFGGFASELCVGSGETEPGGQLDIGVDFIPRTDHFTQLQGRIRLPESITVARGADGQPECRSAVADTAGSGGLKIIVAASECGEGALCETLEFSISDFIAGMGATRAPLFQCVFEVAESAAPGAYRINIAPRRASNGAASLAVSNSGGTLLVRGIPTPVASPTLAPSPTPVLDPSATATATATAERSNGGGSGCSSTRNSAGSSGVLLAGAALLVMCRRTRSSPLKSDDSAAGAPTASLPR
ncbi:MAG: hypothetical protein ACKVX7_11070 [Planctomycetota bacterium]